MVLKEVKGPMRLLECLVAVRRFGRGWGNLKNTFNWRHKSKSGKMKN